MTDAVHPDAVHPDAVHPDAVRADAVRADAARPDAVRADAVRADAVRADAVRPDAVRADAARPDAVRADVARPDVARPGAVRTEVVHTRAELAAAVGAAPDRVAVVMTMGALHEGHRALMRAARERSSFVLVTIFVNPLQFGPNEDFDKYPRTLEADVEACRAEGVSVVFAPSRDEVYPGGAPSITMNAGPLGEILEGASRPGHFAGMLTVVEKLLLLTRAEVAFYGDKDFQQLALIRAMVRDLELGIEIVGVPIVREPDGLALSSRNRFLSSQERRAALVLSRALREGATHTDPDEVVATATKILDDEPGVRVDYLALTGTDLGPAPAEGAARLLVAAKVGTTRLIDNVPLAL